MVCVVCSCCATFPYREVCRAKGGIWSGETLCHDIYPARPKTTVSLAANTYCMTDGHSSCAPCIVGPRVQFSSACEQSHWWPASAYSRRPSVISLSSNDLYWAPLNPALANGHRLKRTPFNPLCLPENLISKHMLLLLLICMSLTTIGQPRNTVLSICCYNLTRQSGEPGPRTQTPRHYQ